MTPEKDAKVHHAPCKNRPRKKITATVVLMEVKSLKGIASWVV